MLKTVNPGFRRQGVRRPRGVRLGANPGPLGRPPIRPSPGRESSDAGWKGVDVNLAASRVFVLKPNVSVHLQPMETMRAQRAYQSSAVWCNRLLYGTAPEEGAQSIAQTTKMAELT